MTYAKILSFDQSNMLHFFSMIYIWIFIFKILWVFKNQEVDSVFSMGFEYLQNVILLETAILLSV